MNNCKDVSYDNEMSVAWLPRRTPQLPKIVSLFASNNWLAPHGTFTVGESKYFNRNICTMVRILAMRRSVFQ